MQIDDLQAFLDVVEAGSVQLAAVRSERSRATYQRALARLESTLGGTRLLHTGPGQRRITLTRPGKALEARARAMLGTWRRWQTETVREVQRSERQIRVGALAGAFDLLAERVRAANRAGHHFVLVEYPADRLPDAVAAGDIDVGVGAQTATGPGRAVAFERIGALPWAVIVPEHLADRFGEAVALPELHEVPLVVHRTGPTRASLERCFREHDAGPLTLRVAAEVESTPRMVDMVAEGFGPAIVTRFRTRYLPEQGMVTRALVDGPAPMVAGLYTRRAPLPPAAQALRVEVRAALEAVIAEGPG